jgi:hypothetical protein
MHGGNFIFIGKPFPFTMKIAAKNRSTAIAWIAWFILSVLGCWAFYTFMPDPNFSC